MNMKHSTTAVLVLGLAAASLTGCKRHDDAKQDVPALPTAAVRVLAIEIKKRTLTEEVTGTVRSKLQARIEAKVAGRIAQMNAVPGQSVKAGEVLVRLDAQEIRARLDQAVAVHEQAQRDLKRTTALLDSGAATRAEHDAVQSRTRVAAAAAKEAETMLGYVDIAAPFDGVVSRKLADLGDLAAPGKALLELEAPDSLRVEAHVGEALISRIHSGQTLDVLVPTVATPLKGTVTEVSPAAEPSSRTFLVKLDLPSAPGLRAGVFARVAVPAGEFDGLSVPSEAVIQRGQLEYIFVAVDGKAQLRLVKTGRRTGNETELLSGASAGEQVVVTAAQVQDGQPLQLSR